MKKQRRTQIGTNCVEFSRNTKVVTKKQGKKTSKLIHDRKTEELFAHFKKKDMTTDFTPHPWQM